VFDIGPEKLLLLLTLGLIVLGPEKLPALVRDAARMLRTLHELANGAREQFSTELGPELGDLDLRALDPRKAISDTILGENRDAPTLNPADTIRRAILGDEDTPASDATPHPNGQRPTARPPSRSEPAPFDTDVT
jgi:sec-independent protein translocase protein TatB